MENIVEPFSDEYKNIYFVKGARNGKYPYSHSLLINDYLIDTGISTRLLRKLKRQFPINNVLLSHWHEDHTSGNRLLSNSKFFIHSKDKFLIENVDKFNEFYGISNTPAEEDFEWLIEGFKLDNTKIDKTLADNEILNVSNDYELEVIHTPGHTAGHCSFLELNSRIAFLADIDLTSFVFYAGIDSDLIDFEESIDRLLDLDIQLVATGHRGIIKGRKEIREELLKYKSVIYKRDERILSTFSETKPVSLKDLKGKNLIYKYYSEFKNYEIIAEMIMIQKHFDKFLKNKLIQKESKGFILS